MNTYKKMRLDHEIHKLSFGEEIDPKLILMR